MHTALKIIALLLITSWQFSCSTQNKDKEESITPDLSSETAKFSYALGLEIGASLKNIKENTELDLTILSRAIKDHLNEKEPLLSQEESNEVKKTVFTRLQTVQAENMKTSGEKNIKDEEAFLNDNKSKEGITTTASGLQYEILRKGTGDSPKATDRVSVNYKGSLLGGTEFDSSYKRGQPSTFNVNQVIKGWSEALQLMQVGGKYKLYIPSKLGYGERGAGDKIGPNATLVFEVELLSIEK